MSGNRTRSARGKPLSSSGSLALAVASTTRASQPERSSMAALRGSGNVGLSGT